MIKNYIKIAWRNITKRRFYSLLNIVGLSTGIVFTLLIGAYVWKELRVNKDLRNAGSHYILTSEWKSPNMGYDIAVTGPLAKRLKEEYPSLVANYYRFDGITSVISKGDKHLREDIQIGDSTLLSMFGFKLLHGDARTALNNPYSVVITEDKAIKYFGKTDVVGETVSIQSFSGSQHDFEITGVLKDMPTNSVIELNARNRSTFFIPVNTMSYFGRFDIEAWANAQIVSYIELQKGVKIADLEKPIHQLVQTHAPDGIKQNLTVRPTALTAYHLLKDNGLVKRMLYALAFVGLFILLMAVINFINISVSSSSARIKEIGIRKVMGGLRKQIIVQFLTESVILVFLSTILALIMYSPVQPLFEEIVGKKIPVLLSFPLYFIFIPAVLVLLVGFLAGLYPAIVLSSLKSVDSIKGKLKSVKENIWLRKSLAGFQFGMACIVIIAAFVVSQQISYFFGKSLGYNKEYIVSSQLPRDWSPEGVRKMETIRNEFATMPQVSNVSLSYQLPNGWDAGKPTIYKAGTDSTTAIGMQLMITDEKYLDTYQIPLTAGSFFDNIRNFDSSKIVLNEQAVKDLGWKDAEEAIGKQVKFPGSPALFTVQGITKDFHFTSMQEKIQPILFLHYGLTNNYRFMSFKIKPGNMPATLAAIEKKWASLLPGSSFEYNFMDDTLKNLYRSELQLKKASYAATMLSIIIVLLGVIGLVSLNIQKRTKEIGIRKVLGSSVGGIIALFMKEILVVIVVAGIIACPIAWLIMDGWLNDYAYRIPLTEVPFIIAVGVLTLITAVLIALQTVKAGLENPVKSLRTE